MEQTIQQEAMDLEAVGRLRILESSMERMLHIVGLMAAICDHEGYTREEAVAAAFAAGMGLAMREPLTRGVN